MNHEQLKMGLTEIAEEQIPPGTDLWSQIARQLPAPEQGGRNRRSRTAILAIAATVFAFMLFFTVTPVGRSWADSIWQLFTPASSERIAIPTDDTYPTMQTFNTIEAAETFLGWEGVRFAADPTGVTLAFVEANRDTDSLRIVYETAGGQLVLSQGGEAIYADGEWESVPAEFIETVSINGATGEYVAGAFVAPDPTAAEAVWNPSVPLQRVRWQDGSRWFELMKQGDPGPLEYLDKAGLIELAEQLNK